MKGPDLGKIPSSAERAWNKRSEARNGELSDDELDIYLSDIDNVYKASASGLYTLSLGASYGLAYSIEDYPEGLSGIFATSLIIATTSVPLLYANYKAIEWIENEVEERNRDDVLGVDFNEVLLDKEKFSEYIESIYEESKYNLPPEELADPEPPTFWDIYDEDKDEIRDLGEFEDYIQNIDVQKRPFYFDGIKSFEEIMKSNDIDADMDPDEIAIKLSTRSKGMLRNDIDRIGDEIEDSDTNIKEFLDDDALQYLKDIEDQYQVHIMSEPDSFRRFMDERPVLERFPWTKKKTTRKPKHHDFDHLLISDGETYQEVSLENTELINSKENLESTSNTPM